MTTDGRWVNMVTMVKSTGHSAPKIKNLVRERRVRMTGTSNGDRYWLEEEQLAFSLRGAKNIKLEKEAEMNGKLKTRVEFVKLTGIKRTQIYDAVKAGWLPSEKNDDGEVCIRYFSKSQNLRLFNEARNKFKNKTELAIVEKETEDVIEKSSGLPPGSMLPIKLWAEYAKSSYSALSKAMGVKLFDECRLKVDTIGGGNQRTFWLLEWPGYERAQEVVKILKLRTLVQEKKYRLNMLCTRWKKQDEKVVEEPQEDFVGDDEMEIPVTTPEPEPEPIREPIPVPKPTPTPEPEPVKMIPHDMSHMINEKMQRMETMLLVKIEALETKILKLYAKNAGY